MFSLPSNNHPALITDHQSYTWKQLKALVEEKALSLPKFVSFPGHPCIENVITVLAAAIKKTTIFPYNYRLPHPPKGHAVDGIFTLLQTSGSTGVPKIACHTLKHYLISAETMIEPLQLSEKSRYFLSLPLYHVAGLAIIFRACLSCATMVLSNKQEYTHCSLVPTQLINFSPPSTLSCILLGGSATHQKMFPHLPIQESYGLTEMSSTVLLNGFPLPKRQIKLSSTGELLVKGPTLFSGYLNQPHTGWFATGDRATRDANGKYQILGRKDHLIISGGENIQPEEIEQAVLECNLAKEVICVAKPCPIYGQRPALFVKPFISLQKVHTTLAPLLPRFKLPIAVYPLPQYHGIKPNRKKLQQTQGI